MFAIIHSDDLLDRLRGGDAEAFRTLVRRHDRALRHFARRFVADDGTAEEVVQETWLAVIKQLDKFEGRSSLKGWIFAILANIARKRATRDARQTVWSSLSEEARADLSEAESDRFRKGHWTEPPAQWGMNPEIDAERKQLVEIVFELIDALPEAQSAVMRLRDVEGLNTSEVAEMLKIDDGNVRVILHRARASIRRSLERRLTEVSS